MLRESLDKTISELEQWQRIFDPTWYLMILMADRTIDSELLRGCNGLEGFSSTTRHEQASLSSNTKLVKAQEEQEKRWRKALVNRHCQPNIRRQFTQNVRS
ncbi:hypothetical protein GGR53DRAFT_485648 [Hypoxylon sp. FL1150]|nr:hypothetical protein GGR53DRAFT_485648 [Hypoxylon sp. FL1150]